MKVRVFGTAAVSLSFLLWAAVTGQAQTPPPAPPQASPSGPLPLPGFMPPYEVARIVRSAGFDPLAPPLREGTTYVLRATDFRGILMRVVVDAHSGAIRAVNRIVAGPGRYGQFGMLSPPDAPPPYYAPPPYAPPSYGGPELSAPDQASDEREMVPDDQNAALPPPPEPIAPPPAAHSASGASLPASPPLPRPRPAELAARKAAADAASAAKTGTAARAPATAPAKPPPLPPLND